MNKPEVVSISKDLLAQVLMDAHDNLDGVEQEYGESEDTEAMGARLSRLAEQAGIDLGALFRERNNQRRE